PTSTRTGKSFTKRRSVARTENPRSSSALHTALPNLPVAPVTRTVGKLMENLGERRYHASRAPQSDPYRRPLPRLQSEPYSGCAPAPKASRTPRVFRAPRSEPHSACASKARPYSMRAWPGRRRRSRRTSRRPVRPRARHANARVLRFPVIGAVGGAGARGHEIACTEQRKARKLPRRRARQHDARRFELETRRSSVGQALTTNDAPFDARAAHELDRRASRARRRT